jgi:Protein of unknown function (DUF3344).
MKKLRMKDKKSLYLVLGILMFSMLCAPALAGRYDYNGYSLETIKNGTVKGDVYVSYGDHAGFTDNLYPTSYYRDNKLVTNFTNVPTSGIQWAMLKVGVYGANTSRSGWMNASLSNSSATELLEGNKWLNVTPPSNLAANVINATGTGVYLVDYDVKSALENLSSSTITATVNAWPDTTWGTSYKLDSRVYGAVLIVVYESGETYTQYWINEGNLNLHKDGNVWVNGTSVPVSDFDADRTWFNGPVNDSLTDFSLTVGYFAGDANQKDYLYFNVPNGIDSPYDLSNPGWSLTNPNYANHLVGTDVADGTGGTKKYFDLKTFNVNALSKSEDNYAIFWRGHDSTNATIWDPSYPTVNHETESYVSPFLAVLKVRD